MLFANSILFSKINAFEHRSEDHDEEIGDVCIANISPIERKKRKRFGIIQFIVSLVVLAILVALDVNPQWRLLLFFMFSAATTSYIQALDKT